MSQSSLNFRTALQRLASEPGWWVDASQSEWDARRMFESVPERSRRTPSSVQKAFMTFQANFQGREMVRRLEAPGAQAIYFHRPVQTCLTQEGDFLVCRVHELGVEGRAYTPRMARAEAMQAVRTKACELNGRLSHTLSPQERLEKRTFLGLVDMAESGLLDGTGKLTWVVGCVDRDTSGKRVFKTLENRAQEFELDDSMTTARPIDGRLLFAQVCTGQAGEPAGPVVRFDETPVDDQVAIWQEWRQKIRDDA